jgi:hypothetical protein
MARVDSKRSLAAGAQTAEIGRKWPVHYGSEVGKSTLSQPTPATSPAIDIDPVLPARFREAHTVNATDMVSEARQFI